jgi:uncharacterized coiled-coil DUF342 family protein
MADDPAETWRATFAVRGQSTSAKLAETQAALAKSQQDLTRVEAELHEALRRAADLEQVREELRAAKLHNEGDREDIHDLTSERDEARAEAKEWRASADKYLSQRDEALHDLAHAKFALSMANTRVDHWKEQAETALGQLNEKPEEAS